MKKNVKQRFSALFLALCLLSVFLLPVLADSTELTTRAIAESQSYLQYQLLTTAFKHQNLRGEITDAYPDYYAGAYIREDGKLVVLLTNTAKANTDSVYALARSSDLIVSTATVSLNELTAQRELIANAWQTLRQSKAEDMPDDLLNLLDSFVGFGIEERNNRIVVSLKEVSGNNISAFKKYLTSYDRIYFEQCASFEKQNSPRPLYLGTPVEVRIELDLYSGSVGYRCYRNINGTFEYGFATAGHFANTINQTVYVGGGNIVCGTTMLTQQSGTLDAAFVKSNEAIEVQNKTADMTIIAGSWCTSFPEGMTVYKYGAASSQTSGTIGSNSYSFSNDGIDFEDMLRCSYDAEDGDSGGIVYTYINGDYAVVGIHYGELGFFSGHWFSNAIATKAHNFYTIHGITPY
ncbi:MAG: hypothetical protein E7452_05285 [Ruminococcaceae bacterium]|nr:hypothetical protein [Oscillospiraceae bacterium]